MSPYLYSTTSTVRYGTRTAVNLYDDDDEDGSRDDTTLPEYDTCSNNTVQCDAIRDCQLGTDETNCGE